MFKRLTIRNNSFEHSIFVKESVAPPTQSEKMTSTTVKPFKCLTSNTKMSRSSFTHFSSIVGIQIFDYVSIIYDAAII